MRLNFQISNIMHQALSSDINIFYRSSNSLFDHILYELDYNYYVLDHKKQKAINVEKNIDLYSYDLFISSSILTKHKDNLDTILHTNTIIFEHHPEKISLKKEDVAILGSQLSKYNTVFFQHHNFNIGNKHTIKYGIPLDVFDYKEQQKKQKILIRHQGTSIYQHVKQILNKYECEELDLDCKIEDINDALNDCTFFIELTDQRINTLCAIAKGCQCICPGNLKIDNDLEGILYFQNINQIPDIVDQNIDNKIDTIKNREYIASQYNYENFCTTMNQLIYTLSKKEAFVL